jgi:hypothetical protein
LVLKNEEFKKIRTRIIEYLMDMGEQRTTKKDNRFRLPDLQPVLPGQNRKKLIA